MPSLGSGEATAVASTTLSPSVTNAAPEACLAMRPVSKTRRFPPVSSTATSCFIETSFYYVHLGNLRGKKGPDAKNPRGACCSARASIRGGRPVVHRQLHLG